MAQAPLRSPVGGRSQLELLQRQAPDTYQAYLNVVQDAPQNFRDMHERKKRPFSPTAYRRPAPLPPTQGGPDYP